MLISLRQLGSFLDPFLGNWNQTFVALNADMVYVQASLNNISEAVAPQGEMKRKRGLAPTPDEVQLGLFLEAVAIDEAAQAIASFQQTSELNLNQAGSCVAFVADASYVASNACDTLSIALNILWSFYLTIGITAFGLSLQLMIGIQQALAKGTILPSKQHVPLTGRGQTHTDDQAALEEQQLPTHLPSLPVTAPVE